MSGFAEDWIKRLDMSPASVGGWFAPALVSNEDIAGSALPPRFGVDHPLYSSNWYLLEAGEVLQLHALKQDELWFFHLGTPIRLHVFSRELDFRTLGIPRPCWGRTRKQARPCKELPRTPPGSVPSWPDRGSPWSAAASHRDTRDRTPRNQRHGTSSRSF